MKKTKKPREWWLVVDPNEPTNEAAFLYDRREDAVKDAASFWRVVHVREVLPKKPKKVRSK